MNEIQLWHVVYTRPRWELRVAERLSARGFETYCPINNTVKQWSDKKKTLPVPLFTANVFVNITTADRATVKATHSNVKFVHWLDKIVIVSDEEIEAIRDLLSQFKTVKVEKVPVNVNERVKVINGAFVFQEGKVVEMQSKNVKVCLPSLGARLVAEFDKSEIKLLRPFGRNTVLAQRTLARD